MQGTAPLVPYTEQPIDEKLHEKVRNYMHGLYYDMLFALHQCFRKPWKLNNRVQGKETVVNKGITIDFVLFNRNVDNDGLDYCKIIFLNKGLNRFAKSVSK